MRRFAECRAIDQVTESRRESSPSTRLRAAAVLLPILLFTLLSPTVFQVLGQNEAMIAGLPLSAIYAFTLWFSAIIVGFFVSRALKAHQPDQRRDDA